MEFLILMCWLNIIMFTIKIIMSFYLQNKYNKSEKATVDELQGIKVNYKDGNTFSAVVILICLVIIIYFKQ